VGDDRGQPTLLASSLSRRDVVRDVLKAVYREEERAVQLLCAILRRVPSDHQEMIERLCNVLARWQDVPPSVLAAELDRLLGEMSHENNCRVRSGVYGGAGE
jgi:hypothetical protein